MCSALHSGQQWILLNGDVVVSCPELSGKWPMWLSLSSHLCVGMLNIGTGPLNSPILCPLSGLFQELPDSVMQSLFLRNEQARDCAYFIYREVKGTHLKPGKKAKRFTLGLCKQPNNKPDLQQIILVTRSSVT